MTRLPLHWVFQLLFVFALLRLKQNDIESAQNLALMLTSKEKLAGASFYSQVDFDRTTLHFGQIDKTASPLTIISGTPSLLHFGQLQILEPNFSRQSLFLFLTMVRSELSLFHQSLIIFFPFYSKIGFSRVFLTDDEGESEVLFYFTVKSLLAAFLYSLLPQDWARCR
ncbi:MAG: hypothetical protein NWE92_12865 [Candidatus Bathyarchaeota archaeon]|nr:hypothetical protein [Candidatus Bathyarchaeota archaeon]